MNDFSKEECRTDRKPFFVHCVGNLLHLYQPSFIIDRKANKEDATANVFMEHPEHCVIPLFMALKPYDGQKSDYESK